MKDFRSLDPLLVIEAQRHKVRPHYIDDESGIEYWHTANRTIYGADETITDQFIADVEASCRLYEVDMAVGVTVSNIEDGRGLPEIGGTAIIGRGVGRVGLYGAAGHTEDDILDKLRYFTDRFTRYDAAPQKPLFAAMAEVTRRGIEP